VWFALCCLAGLVAVVSIKAVTTPSFLAIAGPVPDAARMPPSPDESLTPNRAAKSDRLPLPDIGRPTYDFFAPQIAVAATPVTPTEAAPALPDSPAADETPLPAARKVAHRRWQDANAKLIANAPARRHPRKPHSPVEAENMTGKATVNTLPCRRDAVGGLLRALDLSPRCGS
jgi:hypothetical protein